MALPLFLQFTRLYKLSIKYNKIIFIIFTFSLFLFVCLANNALAGYTNNNKYAAFVMDAETGIVLHKENANKRLHPASLTKMMTLLMLFDALDNGKISLNSRIKISKHAESMIPSKLGLKAGETIKVKHAIDALIIKSANDVSVAVAEKLGGSEENFARMMTKRARELGMNRTRFKNASGLHHPKQVSTARDMAKLGRILVTNYKKYYHYFSKKSFRYKGKTYKSHNKLMNTYEGMDGLKTGYINKSGFNLVSSATRDNKRLIGVVFGGKTGKSRNERMAQILDKSFARLGRIQIAKNTVPIPRKKPHIYPPYYKIAKTTQKPSRWNMLNSTNPKSMFNRMIGQGDYDINIRNRIETGLIAISAHMGEKIPPYVINRTSSKKISYKSINKINTKKFYSADKKGNWTIQVGAFTSRANSNKALSQTINMLPSDLRYARAIIAPYKTNNGWIYRARLHGYTEKAAKDACKILHDCVAIAPKSYQ